ncbi:hypothetical protein MX850_03705 [Erysipelothrix sp. Poltava]|nr:hypothetical protein MX850_03705 [Erysipelothrix sp. Poltava]
MRKRNILPTLFILIGLGCLGGAYILNQEGYRLYAALGLRNFTVFCNYEYYRYLHP